MIWTESRGSTLGSMDQFIIFVTSMSPPKKQYTCKKDRNTTLTGRLFILLTLATQPAKDKGLSYTFDEATMNLTFMCFDIKTLRSFSAFLKCKLVTECCAVVVIIVLLYSPKLQRKWNYLLFTSFLLWMFLDLQTYSNFCKLNKTNAGRIWDKMKM